MHKLIVTLAASVLLAAVAVPPAFAMTGIDAARSCESQKGRCKALFDNAGGVTILVDGYIIDCPTPQGQCEVVGRPSRVKPGSPAKPGMLDILPLNRK